MQKEQVINADFQRQLTSTLSQAYFFEQPDFQQVQVTGKDALDFLHRMSTEDFKAFPKHSARLVAVLNPQSKPQAVFYALHREDGYLLVAEPQDAKSLADYLEGFHFLEELTIADQSKDFRVIAIWDPKNTVNFTDEIFWKDVRINNLKWLSVPITSLQEHLKHLERSGALPGKTELYRYLRLAHNVAAFPTELSPNTLILESYFSEFVARNKGCYPGQETVERIFTYGGVNYKITTVPLADASEKTVLSSAKSPHPSLPDLALIRKGVA